MAVTPIAEDRDRIRRVRQALASSGFYALICSLPKHVLMLTGYWPVVGNSIAVVGREGPVYLVVPRDEARLAANTRASRVLTFDPAPLDRLASLADSVREPLGRVLDELRLPDVPVGSDIGSHTEPASYAATHFYGASLQQLVRELAPDYHFHDAENLLSELRASLTPAELERERFACRLTGNAFSNAVDRLHAGLSETQAADSFRTELRRLPVAGEDFTRRDGFFFCMSGPNAARAHAAYACSGSRILQPGDLVMIHCNSFVDGFWTDVTRTYSLGEPDPSQHEMYRAVFAAREAALAAIKPGVAASRVDRAAREVLARYGFAKNFKHQTGHGVGFDAISPAAKPRLHPESPDMLEPGMVFNVEPAIYIEGYGGMRHCDVVTVTAGGAEVLTPFHSRIEEMVLPETQAGAA